MLLQTLIMYTCN